MVEMAVKDKNNNRQDGEKVGCALWGKYDKEQNQTDFQEALKAFRNGRPAADQSTEHSTSKGNQQRRAKKAEIGCC